MKSPRTRLMCACLLVGCIALARATEQVKDSIKFAGQEHSILERPLNDFLRRSPSIPPFDVSHTANYKGYTASWLIKDAKCYLASFNATTNGHQFAVSSLFPSRHLPIVAEWFSGTIHIVIGRSTLAQSRYTYERITAVRITNGVVIATNELMNVREDQLKML